MQTYDFTRFYPQPFQALAQALAVRVFGAGTKVFGDGPDGAREASFDGPVNLTANGHKWLGYGIIQAKCRMTPRQSKEDADWLVQQIAAEFEKLSAPGRKLRKPDYYVVITNVSLSGVQSAAAKGKKAPRGGKKKVEDLFALWQSRLGLKGWLVWDASELRALLDDFEDVRRRYAAWLTPGDVIAEILELLKVPELSRLVPLIMAREIRNERDIRRKEARQNTEQAIALHDVFIDLPLEQANDGILAKPSHPTSTPQKPESYNVVQELLAAIDELWDEIHSASADVLVVVTTRQQGYSNDLDNRYWEHWTLSALSPSDALRFAARQAFALVADVDRQGAILQRLAAASRDEATAPLMTSPLQVAMLFALAEVIELSGVNLWSASALARKAKEAQLKLGYARTVSFAHHTLRREKRSDGLAIPVRYLEDDVAPSSSSFLEVNVATGTDARVDRGGSGFILQRLPQYRFGVGERLGRVTLPELDPAAFELLPSDPEPLRGSVALLKLLYDRWTEAELPQLFAALTGPGAPDDAAIRSVFSQAAASDNPKLESILLAMYQWYIQQGRDIGGLVEVFKRQLDKKKSELCSAIVCRDLELPVLI